MKLLALLSFSGALLLTGCGDSSKPTAKSTNATSGNPITAPVDYLSAINQANKHAIGTIDLAQLKQAIQSYNIQEGHFPKDLKTLVDDNLLGKIPEAPYGSKIVYDANTGEVSIVKK